MNVTNHPVSSRVLDRPAVARPAGVDVTISDGGVDSRVSVPVPAAKPAAPPTPAPAVASTPQLQATLTAEETEALAQRFAALPRTSAAGVYGRAGRAATAPAAILQGRLIDLTG